MQKEAEPEQYLETIRSLLLFRPLSAGEVQRFVDRAEILTFNEGERIVAEGEIDPSFFIVIRGTVSVMVGQEQNEVFICSIGEGDVFGEAAMFMKVKRTADVVAASDAVLLRIERPELMGFIKDFPTAGNKILMLIVYSLLRKLRDANQELAFERRADIQQDDVDSLVAQLAGG